MLFLCSVNVFVVFHFMLGFVVCIFLFYVLQFLDDWKESIIMFLLCKYDKNHFHNYANNIIAAFYVFMFLSTRILCQRAINIETCFQWFHRPPPLPGLNGKFIFTHKSQSIKKKCEKIKKKTRSCKDFVVDLCFLCCCCSKACWWKDIGTVQERGRGLAVST